MSLSVVIPTYEYYGIGDQLLNNLLSSISRQTYIPSEIIISDHSKDFEVQKICKKNNLNLPIKYYKCTKFRGNPSYNLNFGISKCSGGIIKVMFQDDLFYDKSALELIYSEFQNPISWLLCGCNHTDDNGNSFYNDIFPKLRNDLLFGINKVSSPSVLAFRNKDFQNKSIIFDENIFMLMDCDFYFNAWKVLGEPKYLKKILVTNRIHDKQCSRNYTGNFLREIIYCFRKFSVLPCPRYTAPLSFYIYKTLIFIFKKLKSLFFYFK